MSALLDNTCLILTLEWDTSGIMKFENKYNVFHRIKLNYEILLDSLEKSSFSMKNHEIQRQKKNQWMDWFSHLSIGYVSIFDLHKTIHRTVAL